MTPSMLGDLAFAIATVRPYSTSTAVAYIRTSDTGTVATTGRIVDLSRALHLGTTGGKPLDATVHARAGGPPRWRSVILSVPLEMAFHTSGLNVYVTAAIKHRLTTSGVGSTWATLVSHVERFKMGTDTDATFHTGFAVGANISQVNRYLKANLTYAFRKASSTSAKDTTTSTELVSNSPSLLFSAAVLPQVTVPYQVS